jgi:hypothetical protein
MTKLSDKVKTALDETRMLILGVQILVGFQFRIVFEDAFDHLPLQVRRFNGLGLGFMVAALALLIAPGVYHRIVYLGEDSEEFHRTGSIFVTAATLPLALGLSCDLYVVCQKIFSSPTIGLCIAAGAMTGFTALWYVYPIVVRRHVAGG